MTASNRWNLLENKLQINAPQSTQRAQSLAIPVNTYEKALASRFRTRMTDRADFHVSVRIRVIRAICVPSWGCAMISNQVLDEITLRIAEKFHPEKIILFGSQARGTADSHSDVDLPVISAIKEKRRELMVDMRRVLDKLEYAFDVIVLTREEFERDRNIPGHYRTICIKGRKGHL